MCDDPPECVYCEITFATRDIYRAHNNGTQVCVCDACMLLLIWMTIIIIHLCAMMLLLARRTDQCKTAYNNISKRYTETRQIHIAPGPKVISMEQVAGVVDAVLLPRGTSSYLEHYEWGDAE